MILFRDFNEEKHLDRIWYDSSMIVYSECYDTPDSPLKDLTVTFKNGTSYRYKEVNVNDYVAFVHGGLDGSNGKALNKFIKPKCECEKIGFTSLEELNKELQEKLEEKKNKAKNVQTDAE